MKSVVIFLIGLLCFYFLFSGIFGINGYLQNQSAKKAIIEKKHRTEQLESDIDELVTKQEQLSTEEGLRDSALALGYYVDGDTVFLFDSPSLQDRLKTDDLISVTKPYNPLSVESLVLIAAGISAIITFVIWFLSKNKNDDENDSDFSGQNTNDGSDLYINA